MRQKITKPRQAASARQVDRITVVVQALLTDLDALSYQGGYRRFRRIATRMRMRLVGLLRSLALAERR